MGTGHLCLYHIDIVEHAQWYGMAYGIAVLQAYGQYESDSYISHTKLIYSTF